MGRKRRERGKGFLRIISRNCQSRETGEGNRVKSEVKVGRGEGRGEGKGDFVQILA